MAETDVSQVVGSGAAGGMAVAGVGLLGAKVEKGIATFLEITQFEQHLRKADLVITGEGQLDSQTLQGKVVDGVAKAASHQKKTVVALCGICEIGQSEWSQVGITAVLQLKTPNLTTTYCMAHASELVEQVVADYLSSEVH